MAENKYHFELFSRHNICRENYFLGCQSLIFNLLWCLVIKNVVVFTSSFFNTEWKDSMQALS